MNKGNGRIGKKVSQYTLEGKYVKTYPNARVAWKQTGIYHSTINRSASGKAFAAGGYYWRYTANQFDLNSLGVCQCCGQKVSASEMINISVDCLRKYKQVN